MKKRDMPRKKENAGLSAYAFSFFSGVHSLWTPTLLQYKLTN
jgi:hypothetical protein